MTELVVAMAWRPTEERLPAYRASLAWWKAHYPAARLIQVDTDHEPYNLAAVRNRGVRLAQEIGARVVILTDADAIVATPDSLQAAIASASGDHRLHLPFTSQRYLDQAETEIVLRGGTVSLEGWKGNGAIYVVQPEAYWAFGGSDERFHGWGGDDDQVIAAATTFAGVVRHPGTVWSLWHADENRPIGSREHRPNYLLANRYWKAVNNRRAMRRLIAERQYPGAVRLPGLNL